MRSQFFPNMTELLDSLVQSPEEDRDLHAVVSHVAKIAQAQLEASICVVYAMNPITRQFIEPFVASSNQEETGVVDTLCSENFAREVLKRDNVLIEDLETAGPREAEFAVTLKLLPEVRSIVALSLCIRRRRQKAFGILYLLYQESQSFDASDREFFQIFADQISVILEGVWLQERYREVARVGQDINHGISDIDSLVRKLQMHLSRIVDEQSALLLIVYHSQNQTLDRYHAKEKHLIVDAGHEFDGACQYVIETKKSLFIPHRSKEVKRLPFRFAPLKGTSSQESFIFIPLMLRGEATGVLSIQHPRPDAYTQEDYFILELLANHVALALYNARLYKSLNQLYETGQTLTRQFEAPSTPQAIVDGIKEATQADIVVLYPYDMTTGKFVGPPCLAGKLLQPMPQQAMYPSAPDNIALLMLAQDVAFFEIKSVNLYTSLLHDPSSLHPQRFYLREQICSTAAIPLRVEEKAAGVLFVNFRQQQHFDDSQRLLIEGLAHYAAIAIKNAQTFGRLNERHIHELETLQKIDSVLNTSNPELGEVLNAILRLAHERVPADRSSILLYDEQKQHFTSYAAYGLDANIRMTRHLVNRVNKGITRWVVNHKQAALVNNVHRDFPWRDIYLKANDDTMSELDVPLMDGDGDRVIGVLTCESNTEAIFRQEDSLFLETLAGQAVLAVKKAQAYEREKRFAERFRLLYEAGQELGKVTETQQIGVAYQTIIRLAQELSQSPVVIRRYDEETRQLLLAHYSPYRHSPPSLKIGINEKFNGKVARELRTIIVDDVDQGPSEFRPQDPTIKSLLITPITFKSRYYGNLELTHNETAHFRDKDQEFFEGLAQQLAGTLYRLEITQERQEFAQRALEAETMISIGQATYEIMHRIGNDLGLVSSYIGRIKENLYSPLTSNVFICERLDYIEGAVNKVMDLSESLRTELSTWKDSDHFVLLPPQLLFNEVLQAVPMPDTIETRLEIADDVAPVRVIHPLITDTLRNLVTNAKEAMPEGGLLTLRASNRGRTVRLEVIDTGVGIPPDHQAHIFDLFFSTKEHGSGFGLWSAQRDVLKNRGKLEISSEVQKGTTVALLLPRGEEYTI